MAKNEGGPAFPVECNWSEDAPIQGVQTGNSSGFAMGLSIRDYFAAKVMATLLNGAVMPTKEDRDVGFKMVAEDSYDAADAMLKAREV